MTNQPPPTVPYEAPTPISSSFGMRAANVSWLAALAAVLFFVIALPFDNLMRVVVIGIGVVSLIGGLVSGVIALATMRRYGRNGILRPAIIGLSLNLALFLLFGFFVLAVLDGLAGSVR